MKDISESPNDFLDSFDTFLLDCDGVIWSGSKVIDGVRETLSLMRTLGKRLLFVTNNSTNSRATYVEKFKKLNIEAYEEEIFGSAYAAAYFVKHVLNFPTDKKVYVCGMNGIQDELRAEGVESIGGQSDNENLSSLHAMDSVLPDPTIGAVLFGFDLNINYHKLAKAHTYLQDPNVYFLATNDDRTFPAGSRVYPGTGSLLQVLVSSTGRTPTVLGKPTQNMLDVIVDKYHLNRERTCMIGDRLDTDIEFGKTGGLKTLLVFSGVTSPETLEHSHVKPDFTLPTLGHLIK